MAVSINGSGTITGVGNIESVPAADVDFTPSGGLAATNLQSQVEFINKMVGTDGYAVPVAYASGISLTLTSQTVDYNGVIYAPLSSALPFITSSWGADSVKFRAIQVTDADLITYTPSGTGAVATTVQSKLREMVSVVDFGADSTGATDSSAAIAAAFAASNRVSFPDGTYLMNSGVTKLANNVEVDFGNAKFINGGAGFLFTFGATADTPTYTGLKIRGGWFEQSNPATTSNLNYIRIAATKDFSIRDVYMKNVSNGGVYVEAGCEDGVIDGVTADGMSGYTTNRGIWINGATASDYASQLIDITSITRNATALPTYAAKNIKVVNCTVKLPFYGIYLMNTRDCHIENNHIDISGGGGRCIAINNYSPGAIIKGNTLKCDQAATGILVTQFSHDVIIEGNVFKGSFAGGRDIYVAYLADAMITSNRFATDSTQNIQIDMGGSAVIRGNYFSRPSGYLANMRCVKIDTIDAAVAGTSTYGNTATTLPGLVFEGNVIKVRNCGVFANTPTAQNGNIPGLDVLTVSDNVFYNMNTAATTDEYPLRIYANGSTYVVKSACFDNTVYPEANANRNTTNITGAGHVGVRSDFQAAIFRIVNAAGGGTVTSTKVFGGNFSCAAARSSNEMIISPRTIGGAAGASVATPIGVVDANGNAYKYDIRVSGSSYIIRLFDSAGAQILLSTTAAAFDVLISYTAT